MGGVAWREDGVGATRGVYEGRREQRVEREHRREQLTHFRPINFPKGTHLHTHTHTIYDRPAPVLPPNHERPHTYAARPTPMPAAKPLAPPVLAPTMGAANSATRPPPMPLPMFFNPEENPEAAFWGRRREKT